MLLAVTTSNVGFMWVAIEATTITSALLIPLHRTRASVEASWKYLLICSVGIALAFAGTVLAYFDSASSAGHVADALNWTVLRAAAPSLHRELIQLAFAFILVGYGTKAGLAPMHTWLPDAHSEAPAPTSAMMSGVLLAVAMYAVVRWKAVVDAALGSAFAGNLLLAAGLLSVLIGVFSLVIQRHYKRMLAYSSVEHIGLVSIGLGLGPLGTFAALLHLVNHAVAKSMAFLLAGRILHRYKTTEIARVSGLLRAMPLDGEPVCDRRSRARGLAAVRPVRLGVPARPCGDRDRPSVGGGDRARAGARRLRVAPESPEPDVVRPRARRCACRRADGLAGAGPGRRAPPCSVVLGLALPWHR